MPVSTEADSVRTERNSEAPWDSFDSLAYFEHNYRTLRSDDRQILARVGAHFSAHFAEFPAKQLHGIDVGAGTNLYPALAMLPWCETITLFERSAGNVEWLGRAKAEGFGANWQPFWDVLTVNEPYDLFPDPRAAFSRVADVRQGDLFGGLPGSGYGIGTMFFVAESLSTEYGEFQDAVSAFAGSLAPGAPFAAAFMENSLGYEVGDLRFPACRIEAEHVTHSLEPFAAEGMKVERIDIPAELLLRDGYTGMLLALGRRSDGTG
ncbi:SCO2525 family SAM-dependent methyltransferase [Kitasatospora camelliae]|uniref:SCO2525 family SAM-dependent methyltransferase n=1 Tax=Kitasatospora camelliae TaxID=3156397 RepID=A0AAU8JX94_9ACTN